MKLPSPDKDWFVVRARSGAELIAADELRAGGYEAYVPQCRIKGYRAKGRLLLESHRPLFRGYLFLASERGRQVDWGHIRDNRLMRHVGRPLRAASGFALRIPARLVIAISVDETNGVFDETGQTKKVNHTKLEKLFAKGKEVRIEEGPFIGFAALIECVTGHDRIRALVEMFGQKTVVEFMPEQLSSAA